MYIDLDQNKYINSYYVKTMEREGVAVYFKDKDDKLLGIKTFRTEQEAENYWEEEFCRMLNVIGQIPYEIEKIGYDIEGFLKEIKQIREVLYYRVT